jgi:hypothetical protein
LQITYPPSYISLRDNEIFENRPYYLNQIENIEADLGIFHEIMENINGDRLA